MIIEIVFGSYLYPGSFSRYDQRHTVLAKSAYNMISSISVSDIKCVVYEIGNECLRSFQLYFSLHAAIFKGSISI